MGCPIRKSTDQSLFAAPHGLSQRITSFIACACQGIHQMPLYHLIIPIANVHHSRKAFTPIPSVGIVCTGRGSQAIRRPVGLRIPYPEMGFVSVSWSSARWRLATGRERCSWDVFSFHDEAFASSFEHRKREGCAILVASCSGTLVPIPSGERIGERPAS